MSVASLGRGFDIMNLRDIGRSLATKWFKLGVWLGFGWVWFGWVLFGLGGRGLALGCQRSTPQALAMSWLRFNS